MNKYEVQSINRLKDMAIIVFTDDGEPCVLRLQTSCRQAAQHSMMTLTTDATNVVEMSTRSARRVLDELECHCPNEFILTNRRYGKICLCGEASNDPKPYHLSEIGQQVIIDASEFTCIKNMRNVVADYGRRNNKKFSVKEAADGSAIILRTE